MADWRCRLGFHGDRVIQSMKRNGTWAAAPDFPESWAGNRIGVRAVCVRCGKVVIPAWKREDGR